MKQYDRQDNSPITEVSGDYSSAKRLYQRILASRRLQLHPNAITIVSSVKDLERVELCQAAELDEKGGRFEKASIACREVLVNVNSAGNIDLKTKLALMETIYKKIALRLGRKYGVSGEAAH